MHRHATVSVSGTWQPSEPQLVLSSSSWCLYKTSFFTNCFHCCTSWLNSLLFPLQELVSGACFEITDWRTGSMSLLAPWGSHICLNCLLVAWKAQASVPLHEWARDSILADLSLLPKWCRWYCILMASSPLMHYCTSKSNFWICSNHRASCLSGSFML